MRYFLTAVFVVAAIPFIINTCQPEKYAVKVADISKYPNAILVREEFSTGTGWFQVGDPSGEFGVPTPPDVYLSGNTPPGADPTGNDNENTFLCVVEYVGMVDDYYGVCRKYVVLDWYPIYPVKRNTILPSWLYPRGYMTKSDLKNCY